jgi:3-deoxy-D-manno-octulosonate 8-phosphate phosphatase (KDO 8-P phosphatase)
VLIDPATLSERARRVRLILLDVDGVLTDGAIHLADNGAEQKRFDIRDGTAVVWAQGAGLAVGLLSGRQSAASARRASQLGIAIVVLGAGDKLDGYRRILDTHGFTDEDVAYMGDDLLDLPVLARVGLSSAPSDAVPEVLGRVHWVSGAPGGRGAVRELIELVLRAQGRWNAVVGAYLGQEPS